MSGEKSTDSNLDEEALAYNGDERKLHEPLDLFVAIELI